MTSKPGLFSQTNQVYNDLQQLKVSLLKAQNKLGLKLQKINSLMKIFAKHQQLSNGDHQHNDAHLNNNVQAQCRNQVIIGRSKQSKGLIKNKINLLINHGSSANNKAHQNVIKQDKLNYGKINHRRSNTEHFSYKKDLNNSSTEKKGQQIDKIQKSERSSKSYRQKIQILKLGVQNKKFNYGLIAHRGRNVQSSLQKDQKEDQYISELKISKSEQVQNLMQSQSREANYNNQDNYTERFQGKFNKDNFSPGFKFKKDNGDEQRLIKKGKLKSLTKMGNIIKNKGIISNGSGEQDQYEVNEIKKCVIQQKLLKIQQRSHQIQKQHQFQLKNIEVTNLQIKDQKNNSKKQTKQNSSTNVAGLKKIENNQIIHRRLQIQSNKINQIKQCNQKKIEVDDEKELKQGKECLETETKNQPEQIHYRMVKFVQQIRAQQLMKQL